MKLISFGLIAALAAGCGTAKAQAPQIQIPLVNADFEAQVLTNPGPITDPANCGTAQHFDTIPGWTFVHVNPGSGGGVAHWTCDDGMPPSQVAFLGYGEAMYQVTNVKAQQGTYRFEADASNWFYPYPGNGRLKMFQVNYDASGNLIWSPAPFCSYSFWSLGDMKRKVATCDMPGYFLQVTSPDPLSVGGQNPGGFIAIWIEAAVPDPALGNHAAWEIKVDNVALFFTPQN